VLSAAVAVLGLALAACGGSSSAGSSPAASGGSGQTGASLAQAKQVVQQLLARPAAFTVPTLPSRPPTGKTIDFIACGVPSCQAYIPILRQATDAVGWHLVAINSGITAQSVAAAYDQAVRNKPSGGVIGSGGDSPTLFSHQLQELHAEGVPVVLQVVPPTTATGVSAVVLSKPEEIQFGTEMADYILANSGGHNVHLGIVTTPQTPVFSYEHGPLTKALSSSSCSSCSVSTFSFPETDLGTTLPSEVVSFVRSNPDINYLFFDFSGEVDGVPAALHAAGFTNKIKIVTNDDTATESAYMNAGEELAASGNPWPEVCWKEVDILLSAAMNVPLGPSAGIKLPNMILTKSNLPKSSGFYFPLVTNYQQIFKQAWHVSS
jgi:ribose transport system substrate-binding protein